MHVKDLMTSSVRCCRPDDSLARAAQLMWEGDVGAIAVVEGNSLLRGIITDRDICMAAYTQGCTLSERTVGSAMSTALQTCRPSESVRVAEERMRMYQLHRLPVVDDAGRLSGMLSLNDLARAAGDRKAPKGSAPSLEDVAITLARIGEHRRRAQAAAAQ